LVYIKENGVLYSFTNDFQINMILFLFYITFHVLTTIDKKGVVWSFSISYEQIFTHIFAFMVNWRNNYEKCM